MFMRSHRQFTQNFVFYARSNGTFTSKRFTQTKGGIQCCQVFIMASSTVERLQSYHSSIYDRRDGSRQANFQYIATDI